MGVRVVVWVLVEVGVDESVVVEDVDWVGDEFGAVPVTVAVDGRIVRGRRGVALVKRDRSGVCVRSVVSTAVLGEGSFSGLNPRQPAVAPTSASAMLRKSERRVVFEFESVVVIV